MAYLLGDHAAAMGQILWQHDTPAIVHFMKECMGARGDLGLQSQAPI